MRKIQVYSIKENHGARCCKWLVCTASYTEVIERAANQSSLHMRSYEIFYKLWTSCNLSFPKPDNVVKIVDFYNSRLDTHFLSSSSRVPSHTSTYRPGLYLFVRSLYLGKVGLAFLFHISKPRDPNNPGAVTLPALALKPQGHTEPYVLSSLLAAFHALGSIFFNVAGANSICATWWIHNVSVPIIFIEGDLIWSQGSFKLRYFF